MDVAELIASFISRFLVESRAYIPDVKVLNTYGPP